MPVLASDVLEKQTMQKKRRVSVCSINASHVKTWGTLGKLLRLHTCPRWIRQHTRFPGVSHSFKRAASSSIDKKLGTFCYFNIIILFMW